MASGATPISLNGTADSVLGNGRTKAVYGFAVRETTGTAGAVFKLRCQSATGQVVVPISLAAGESTSESWPTGIAFDRGVFEDWISGAYEGTVFVGEV